MVDILRGVIGATSSYVLSWVMPLAFATLAFIFLVLQPAGVQLDETLRGSDPSLALVSLSVAMLAGGLILSALATPLYRVLEGYSWPTSWRDAGVRRQTERKAKLTTQQQEASTDLERALVAEKLDRFPVDDGQLAPTSLGNAMRAFETFGVDRYRLDSQAFWVELTTVAPEHLRGEIGRARAAVDFFVAQVFLSAVFSAAAVVVALVAGDQWFRPAAAALAAALLVPVFYRGAVSSTTYWNSTVRALLNLGRPALAKSLGLTLPRSLAEERLMWERLAGFNYYAFEEEWVSLLDDFRAADAGPPDDDDATAE